jgi:tetrapyrrole methylase family protein/MazG family protein
LIEGGLSNIISSVERKAIEINMSDHLNRLAEIMAHLRGPEGCPWDKEQTVESLKKYLLEEVYELIESLEGHSTEKIKEELGDLLFQVFFLSHIFKEQGLFDVQDVAKMIGDKLVRRHPHVFGNKKATNSEEVLDIWTEEKKKENGDTNGQPKEDRSLVDGIPKHQPSLLRAQQISTRVARSGFEWENTQAVIEKLHEEIGELQSAISLKNETQLSDNITEEVGDMLFTIVNIARHLKIDAEFALHKTCDKFEKRWRCVEADLAKKGISAKESNIEELEAFWQQAKNK